ncbi:C4-type zinc ribbon domain-containing protein [Bdellovibrionota bacterium FG-1]
MSHTLPLKDQLKALEHVQEIDLQIDQLKKNKGTLPASLKALDDQLGKLNATVTLKKVAIGEIEKTQRQTAAALELTRDRLSRSTTRLESVQNSQEYQAANKEIDQLRKQQESLDEQSKKSLKDMETIHKDLADIEVNMGKVQAERDAQASVLTGQTGKMESEIQGLLQDRAKFQPKIDPRTLSQYDRVRVARNGIGIVPAIAGRCKGCNMMVPAQQFNEIQRGNALHSCPSCHRLLFAPTAGEPVQLS